MNIPGNDPKDPNSPPPGTNWNYDRQAQFAKNLPADPYALTGNPAADIGRYQQFLTPDTNSLFDTIMGDLALGGSAAALAATGASFFLPETAGAGAASTAPAVADAGAPTALGDLGVSTGAGDVGGGGVLGGSGSFGAGATADMPTVIISGGAGGSALPDLSGALPYLGTAGTAAVDLAGTGQGTQAQGGAGSADVGSFLPATSPSDIASLSPTVANQFGITGLSDPLSTGAPDLMTGTGASDWTAAGYADPSLGLDSFSPTLQDVGTGAADQLPGNFGGGNGLMNWLSNPKNLAQLGMLGISGINALKKPALPGAAQTALNAAGPAVKQAQNVISSGGTATPAWATQKASIDAQIDQQIKQATEQLMQTAANSGEGNQNSGIVQQQIAQITQNANVQRQQLYAQAQQQNVSNAVSELTGGNQTLSAIAQMQLEQEQAAQQAARQTAQLALQLEQLSWPGG